MSKYKQGRKIESVADFEKSKCKYYKVYGRTTHRAWIASWQYRVLENFIKAGAIYEAELINKESEIPCRRCIFTGCCPSENDKEVYKVCEKIKEGGKDVL